jgi:muramoyltetrapeptide carboxypeptidase
MKTIKPQKLSPGDSIGIFALSNYASLNASKIARAYDFFKSYDLKIVEAKNLYHEVGHSAGTIKERVEAFHALIRNKKIKMLVSFWGGFQTHQVLEYLDFDLIKKNPKIIIGYSDTTSLLNAIHAKTGLVCFNGPAVITFIKPEIPPLTLDIFEQIFLENTDKLIYEDSNFFSDNQWYINNKMEWSKNPGRQIFRHGKAQGQIVAGNVGTLLLLAGTKYWPQMKKKILILEDDESEKPETIDRFFTQLRQMGVFKQIKGLIIGRFARSVGFSKSDSLHMILEDALKGYKFPVITEVDFGHTDQLWTIPVGIKIKMDTKNSLISLQESCLR